jgi:hypothetical protein
MISVLLTLSLIQGFTLRGTVWQGDDKPIRDAVVTIAGAEGTLETTSASDGTFKFTVSKPGYFQLSAKRGKFSGQPSTMFVDKDMDGVGIMLRPMVSLFAGRVHVEDQQELPKERLRLVIKYPSGSVIGRYDISQAGVFIFGASAPEFNVALEGLSEPYFVKSIMFGDLDLTRNPMKLIDIPGQIQPIVINLGIRK